MDQETSEEKLFIKARQKLDTYIYRDLCFILNSFVSIENYEIQISKSVFHAYPSYLCRVSFLTILDIYKDNFKGRLRWCNLMQSDYSLKLWPEIIFLKFSLIHLFLKELLCLCTLGFCNQVLLDLHCWWREEICSQ